MNDGQKTGSSKVYKETAEKSAVAKRTISDQPTTRPEGGTVFGVFGSWMCGVCGREEIKYLSWTGTRTPDEYEIEKEFLEDGWKADYGLIRCKDCYDPEEWQ